MSNNTITTDNVIFDPAIHAVNPDGTPKMCNDGTFAKKPGRKAGTPNTGTGTRGGFNVEAVTGAYLARVMAAGDLDALMAFNGMTKGQRVEFLRATPEYAETVTVKVVEDAATKINAILEAAGEEHYHAIMDKVRFG